MSTPYPPGPSTPPPPPPPPVAPAVPAASATAPPPPPPSAPPAPPAAPASGAEPLIVRTDADAKDGLVKCLRCGATEISLNPANGHLTCHFCRFEWQGQAGLASLGLDGDIGQLTGIVMGSGSVDIVPSTDEVLTFKCTACGAEVVIDTAHGTQARCHWCRNKLSMNQQVPNGAVPDVVLPFSLPKAAAVAKISEFVNKRQFFAHPTFKAEFNPENVMGVYLPYMVVDVNAHVTLTGQGEHETRSYTVKDGDKERTVFDVDVYDVARDFDLHVDDLTVESSSERLSRTSDSSNNIINAIMPFDVENAVRYDSNYLAGFASERRDSNIDQLTPLALTQAGDIARHKANATLKFYDRGVRWDDEQVQVVGQRWVAAYLPVWLYSYHQTTSDGKSFLHYVAVNARTGETMGSVPIHKRKLFAVSAVVEVIGAIVGAVVMFVGG
ncbi:TFIIB-type zinc ribbon-containing protein [Actinotalea subterranea]|uniref:TFIIB-type zinc ribbon-containing protein n=1 Tax=Actinotalea subterranea TaxID=2607497 RepID=UPI001FEA041F|nr:TFIIB-type zinc ribbon-containing protein [Actinotalea subterranea]